MIIRKSDENRQLNTLQIVTLALMFLAGMNFMDKHYYLCFGAFLVSFIFTRRLFVNLDSLLLVILGVCWLIFSPSSIMKITYFIKPFVYVLAYCVGTNFWSDESIQNSESSKIEKSFTISVVIIALGPQIHFLLNWIYNLNKSIIRNTYDFWTGNILSATNQTALSCMMVGLLAGAFFTRTQLWKKIVAIALLVMSLVYNLTLGGRTLIFLPIAAFALSFLFVFIKNKEKTTKQRAIFTVACFVFGLYFIYEFNIFGIQDFIEDSGFYNRFFTENSQNILEDGRIDRKLLYLENFFDGIFGGSKIRSSVGGFYAHDIFLDTYDEAGLLALLAIGMYVIQAIWRMFVFVNDETYGFNIRLMIFSLYVVIGIEFLIEPILIGVPWLFTLFCLIDGMIGRLNYASKRKMYKQQLLVE